jgi:putative protease
MKSIFYVGGVTRIYRAALDYLKELPAAAWENPAEIRLPEKLIAEIEKTGTRGGTENFFKQVPGGSEMIYDTTRMDMQVEPVAVLRKEGASPLVEARNVLETGDAIEYMLPGVESIPLTVKRIETENGEEIIRANPGNRVVLYTEPSLEQGRLNGILRREKKLL